MSDSTTRSAEAISTGEALAAPFDPREIKFKPQMVKNNRCLAMAYIDARLIQDRLDEVLGVENWEDRYTLLPDGSVMCKLRCKIGDRWITKTDVGSPSEQPDGGDRLKAAFSDALKRAAVKFGIGRYLYRLPAAWVDYDPVKKQIVQPPQLPAWALPKAKTGVAAPPAPAPKPAPAPVQKPTPAAPPKGPRTPRGEFEAKLRSAKNIADLQRVWETVPRSLQPDLEPVKNECKAALGAQPTNGPWVNRLAGVLTEGTCG